MKRILIVEDDNLLNKTLAYMLIILLIIFSVLSIADIQKAMAACIASMA